MLLAVLCAILCLPLILLFFCHFVDPLSQQTTLWQRFLAHKWLRNASLSGTQVREGTVKLDSAGLLSGQWQRFYAGSFDQNFPGREALIRWVNEAYLALFHQSAQGVGNHLYGQENALFERFYLKEYYTLRQEPQKIELWVSQLQELQDICRSRGMAFVLVLTPSKVAMCQEWVPSEWNSRKNPRPRSYDLLVHLLHKHGIAHVDGVEITRKLIEQGSLKTTPFPLGGIHWSFETAAFTADAIIASLNKQGLSLEPLSSRKVTITQNPSGWDSDILDLMNLARPWHYPAAEVTVNPTPGGKRYTLAGVGGSFGQLIVPLLNSTNQFSEIDYFFYLKIKKQSWYAESSKVSLVREPVRDIDIGREIFGADILLLELNESTIVNQKHISTFLERALAWLRKNPSVKSPFLYESYLDCPPGIDIPISANFPTITKKTAFSQFGIFDLAGAWSNDNEGTIRLHWGGAEGIPIKLRMTSGVDLGENAVTKAVVAISINGTWVADWEYDERNNVATRELVIPLHALKFGRDISLTLSSRQVQPPLQTDATRPGPKIFVSNIRLSE